MQQLLTVGAIGVGGAVGSMLRYGLSVAAHSLLGRAFPYGTLTVNVLGCLAMGLLFVYLDRFSHSDLWRAGLLIGVLGGFTTFSAFSIETFNLFHQGEAFKALANILLSVGLCIGATWLGVVLAKQM